MTEIGEEAALTNLVDNLIGNLDNIITAYESKSFKFLYETIEDSYKTLAKAQRTRRAINELRANIKGRDFNGHFAKRTT